MANKFFENEMIMSMCMTPNDAYRGAQQAFIDDQWENTAVETVVEEQDYIGADTFHKIHVWMSKVIGTTTTFMKNGTDYRSLMYKELDYFPERGTYFKYDNNYWISDFVNPSDGVVGGNTIRRCTNFLRIVDPENGSIFTAPCVLDYDMTSPSVQVSNAIITPNNHAIVIVQANPDTMRLFTYNKRFVIGGRVFKLTAYQNALMANVEEKEPTILYLDLSLDELHDGDDLVHQVANNGTYDYAIVLNRSDFTIPDTAESIDIMAYATLNGEQIDKPILWCSNNNSVVTIKDGKAQVVGKGVATLRAWLKGNYKVYAEVKITVADKQEIVPVVIMENAFDSIRQFEIKYAQFSVNGEKLTNLVCALDKGITDNNVLSLSSDGSTMTVECINPSKDVQTMYVEGDTESYGHVSAQFNIKALSMMG